MEETPEQYIERIRSHTGYEVITIVPNTPYYQELINRRPDLKLTLKGQTREICPIVLAAIKKANEK